MLLGYYWHSRTDICFWFTLYTILWFVKPVSTLLLLISIKVLILFYISKIYRYEITVKNSTNSGPTGFYTYGMQKILS